MRKLNEVAIFEAFRIKISDTEKEEVENLKKQFKESPISTTGLLIIEIILKKDIQIYQVYLNHL